MESINKKSEIIFLSLSLTLIFLLLTGGKVIDPTYIEWITLGDEKTHWLNWLFFRETNLFQFPIFKNYLYGLDISSSLVLNDALPIMAILFKPISGLLPDNFQYFGIWLYICFILQGFTAFFLISKFTNDRLLCLVGSLFFTIAPPFLWRLHGHYSLMGQWLILYALYIYFDNDFKFKKWFFLISFSLLINAYFSGIIFGIFLVDLIQARLKKLLSDRELTVRLASITGWSILFGYLLGYFLAGVGSGAKGFGLFRANLDSFFDSDNHQGWSRILPDLASVEYDHEGFAFLGIGILILLAISLIVLFFNQKKINIDAKKVLPISCLGLMYFIFSLSNNVVLGDTELFQYDIPAFLNFITKPFRSSGRFIWLPFYLIYCFIFYILSRNWCRQYSRILVLIFFALQIYDSSEIYSHLRNKFSRPEVYWKNDKTIRYLPGFNSPLKDGLWKEFPKKYSNIFYVVPQTGYHHISSSSLPDEHHNFFPLSYYAASNKMGINSGYFSRYSKKRYKLMKDKLEKSIKNNQFDKNAIYYFNDDDLWSLVLKYDKRTNFIGEIDGYRIFAPGYYK